MGADNDGAARRIEEPIDPAAGSLSLPHGDDSLILVWELESPHRGNIGRSFLSGTTVPYLFRLRPILTVLCGAGCTAPGTALEPASAPRTSDAPASDGPIEPTLAVAAAQPGSEWADPSADKTKLCGSTKAFNAQVTTLYKHPCLAVARGDEPMMSFELTSGLEAKTYWDDGLSIWLRSYLDLADGTDTTV